MRIRQCYLCNLPFEGSERWSPDRQWNIERLHCSKQCFRMYKIAYESDNAFRLEHSIRRAREELISDSVDDGRKKELNKWIKALEKRLKMIKRTRRMNKRLKGLKDKVS